MQHYSSNSQNGLREDHIRTVMLSSKALQQITQSLDGGIIPELGVNNVLLTVIRKLPTNENGQSKRPKVHIQCKVSSELPLSLHRIIHLRSLPAASPARVLTETLSISSKTGEVSNIVSNMKPLSSKTAALIFSDRMFIAESSSLNSGSLNTMTEDFHIDFYPAIPSDLGCTEIIIYLERLRIPAVLTKYLDKMVVTLVGCKHRHFSSEELTLELPSEVNFYRKPTPMQVVKTIDFDEAWQFCLQWQVEYLRYSNTWEVADWFIFWEPIVIK